MERETEMDNTDNRIPIQTRRPEIAPPPSTPLDERPIKGPVPPPSEPVLPSLPPSALLCKCADKKALAKIEKKV